MQTGAIPRADYAIIGGSGTYSLNFPEELNWPGLELKAPGLIFETPFGPSPPLKLFVLNSRHVLTVKMHGWRKGIDRGSASRQLFWVLKEAGVKVIFSEGGVGAINRLLKPKDIIIPDDYLDFSMRKDCSLGYDSLLIMRQPTCPRIKEILVKTAQHMTKGRVFDCGVYAVTDGRHFESPAEVRMLYQLGADIVGQSMCPEVYLAREIGACYGRLDVVVNYAEGIVKEWDYDAFVDMFYNYSTVIGSILLDAVCKHNYDPSCGCSQLRKDTLLK